MRSWKHPTLVHRPRASGRGEQSGGSRGCGCRRGGRSSPSHTTELEPIYEEGDESGVEETWLEGDWVLSDDDGRTPRCTFGVAVWPSHTAGHEDTVPAQTMSSGAGEEYEDPQQSPCMSPPVFSGFAHDGGCIFVPTPGMPTPPLVHMEPTMGPSSPTPHEEAVQIEQIQGEGIELVERLRRSRSPPTHAPDCGTGDGQMRPVACEGIWVETKRSLSSQRGRVFVLPW